MPFWAKALTVMARRSSPRLLTSSRICGWLRISSWKSLRGSLRMDAGVAGLVPCGTTGESAAMTTDEWEHTLAVVVEQAAGRVPVIAGAGSNQTAKAVDLSRRCARRDNGDGIS